MWTEGSGAAWGLGRPVSQEITLLFLRPKKPLAASAEAPVLGCMDVRALADGTCRYDLNDVDAAWLELTNEEFRAMGEPGRW